MIGHIKTTLLLLFLLCVTKPIQAENEESTEKLISSNDSEVVESKANISESSTLKSLEKLKSTTENVEKTTEVSAEGGDKKEQSVLKDEIKTAEEKKGNHTLRRKRRSHISGIKQKYTRDESDDNEESNDSTNSDSKADEDESDSGVSDSSESNGSGEDNTDDTVSDKGNEQIINFFKTFFDDSCVVIESFSSFQNSMENILVEMERREIHVHVDPDDIMSFLSDFKEDWEEYCNGPKETNDALEFFHNLLYLITKGTRYEESKDEEVDLSNENTKRGFFHPMVISSIANAISSIINHHRSETKRLDNPLPAVMTFLQKFTSGLDLPPPIKAFVSALTETLGNNKRSDTYLALLSSIVNTYGELLADVFDGQRSEGGPDLFSMISNTGGNPLIDSKQTGLSRRSEDKEPSLEKVLQKYCELSRGSSNIIMTLKALVKEFDVEDEPGTSRRQNTDSVKFFNSLRTIISRNSDTTKRSGYEATFIKEIMEKYCEEAKRSNSALTSISKVLVPQEGNSTRRSTLVPSKTLLDDYIDGSKGSVDMLDYLKYFLANYCEVPDPDTESLDSANKRIAFQRTVKRPVRPKEVRSREVSSPISP